MVASHVWNSAKPCYLFIFPGVAFLLVIYVLLCMICCWDLWHGGGGGGGGLWKVAQAEQKPWSQSNVAALGSVRERLGYSVVSLQVRNGQWDSCKGGGGGGGGELSECKQVFTRESFIYIKSICFVFVITSGSRGDNHSVVEKLKK